MINIIAGGGGGGGAGGSVYEGIGNNGGKGGNGGAQGENGSSSIGGSSGGEGGSINGTGGGNGGSFNSNGNGFNASADILNTGGGGGGAGINGITGSGGGTSGAGASGLGGVNGGGGGYSTIISPFISVGGGGGAAGYGGGGGGTFTDNNNGSGGGGGGSSIVLLGGQNTLYTSAPYKNLIYGSEDGGGGHGYVLIYWDDKIPIASNICFPAGTPIQTDQGIIPIEKINTNTHTINRQNIKHITQTITYDKYLIHFQPNSIGYTIPNKPTTMSKDHKILYNGNLVPAFRFLDLSDKVTKINYSGELLYNVLLDDYSLITVNNMKCETLHPENAVAKLYMNFKKCKM